MISADQNGWSDTPEEESEGLSFEESWEIPDSLPPGTPDPYSDDWGEEMSGPEYWLTKRWLEDGEV